MHSIAVGKNALTQLKHFVIVRKRFQRVQPHVNKLQIWEVLILSANVNTAAAAEVKTSVSSDRFLKINKSFPESNTFLSPNELKHSTSFNFYIISSLLRYSKKAFLLRLKFFNLKQKLRQIINY